MHDGDIAHERMLKVVKNLRVVKTKFFQNIYILQQTKTNLKLNNYGITNH